MEDPIDQPDNGKLVTITRAAYEHLMRQSNWLTSLENAGVDNWEGMSFAHEIHRENHPEDCDD